MDDREVKWNEVLRSLLADTPCKGTLMRTIYRITPVYTVHLFHPTGGCCFAVAPEDPYQLTANVDISIVHEKDRGNGAGRALVELLEEFSRTTGVSSIVIGANENPSFWNHMGYQPVPETDAERYRALAQAEDRDFTIDFYEAVPTHLPHHKIL